MPTHIAKTITTGDAYGKTRRVQRGEANTLVLAFVCIAALCSGAIALLCSSHFSGQPQHSEPTENQASEQSESTATQFDVKIRKPLGAPVVETGQLDFHGKPVTVSCSTCHGTRPANFENKVPTDLNEFHSNLELVHGDISCLSCHNDNNYDSLKLADGTQVEFTNVMTLCSQCHGKQAREFELGVHGGMAGHWDRSRGSQQKNNCVDCHHPHMPAFPKMKPTFKPRDRFLEKSEQHDEH